MTIPDKWDIHRSLIRPLVTNTNKPIDETVIFKGPYTFLGLSGKDIMVVYEEMRQKALKAWEAKDSDNQ